MIPHIPHHGRTCDHLPGRRWRTQCLCKSLRSSRRRSGEGNLEEFSCPYHGWLYDLQGKLIGVPYMKEAEGFDPANCRLKPLRLGTWAGWVFINFDEYAESFESSIAWFDDAFGMFQMEDCRFSGKYVTELDCNWKFVNENLMDVYHF